MRLSQRLQQPQSRHLQGIGTMTEFQYLFLRSTLSELLAEGIDAPAWNSEDWTKHKTGDGIITLIWLGELHVIRITVNKDKYGACDVGSVLWEEKVDEDEN